MVIRRAQLGVNTRSLNDGRGLSCVTLRKPSQECGNAHGSDVFWVLEYLRPQKSAINTAFFCYQYFDFRGLIYKVARREIQREETGGGDYNVYQSKREDTVLG